MEFQKYSKYPDYYRLFCFLCIVCLFWWFYGFLWRVFAIEKLEYSRYNTITKYELVWYNTYSSDLLFSYTNESHDGFVEFCVIDVFKFWVILRWMKEGWKSLILGMPQHPKLLSKNEQPTKLGASPLSSNDHRYFTRNYIFIRHMICVLLGASCIICVFACFILCFKSSILAVHTYLREPKICHDLLELLICFT